MTKIMVVDDEKEMRNIISDYLGSAGYEVSTAGTGEECLDKLEEEDPDLILLDRMLPGMDGWEIQKRIEATNPDFIVAFLSTLDSMPDLEKTGLADYIPKRTLSDKKKFLRRVRRLVRAP